MVTPPKPPSSFHDSMNGGTFSTSQSNTPSGPRSTCSPCGNAIVLMPGFFSFAIAWISALSSGVHMEAQNCQITSQRNNQFHRRQRHTRRSGLTSSTVAATSSIAGRDSLVSMTQYVDGHPKARILTFSISRVNDGIFVLDRLDESTNDLPRSFWSCIDGHQLERT